MSDEDKKGRLPEDDVGTPEESSGFEDKINATLDKILDDDEDEFDDIIVDYEEAGEEEESEDAEEEETGDTSEKTIIWNGPSETKSKKSLRRKKSQHQHRENDTNPQDQVR